MTNHSQAPKVEKREGDLMGERITHPAFGQIEVIRSSLMGKGGIELFGSDLHHRNIVTVRLKTAYVNRSLNQDWVHADKTLVEFNMSEAQWAAFVSSHGASGTPVTFTIRAEDDSPLMRCPGIESPETKRQTYEREMREACEAYSQKTRELAGRIAACVADGKAGKGTLQELLKLAESLADGMPKTMAFVQSQFSEAMENTVEAGKVEMESFVYNLAKHTGIEMLREQSVQMLEARSNKDKD